MRDEIGREEGVGRGDEQWEGGGNDWHGEEGWRMRLWRCESCCCMIRRSQEIGGSSG